MAQEYEVKLTDAEFEALLDLLDDQAVATLTQNLLSAYEKLLSVNRYEDLKDKEVVQN
jgi:hypothetical protein